MKNVWKILIIILVIIFVLGVIFYIMNKNKKKSDEPEPKKSTTSNVKYSSSDMNMVLSLEDKITDDTAWCGTFNLVWNDLKNELAKQDIVFTPQLEIVKNLNKGTFNTKHLSKDSYYKVYGKTSLELKQEIEKAIKEKFNETSDILDNFNWESKSNKCYFLYAMLKKQFQYPTVFSKLENGKFGNYENVQYFGINNSTDDNVREQLRVLYYNSKNDFAIKISTLENDEVIISKGNSEDTFGKMYEQIEQNSKNYKGNKSFTKMDKLKIPNISFNLKKQMQELENKVFYFSNGDEHIIDKALQTIQFELDEKGGKIKSEAGISVKDSAMIVSTPNEPREFLVDDTFTIFLKEIGKELPYFAAKISNIKNVQN